MNPRDTRIARLLELARQARPAPPATPAEVDRFAGNVAAEWARTVRARTPANPPADPWLLWERAGACALALAAAVVVATLLLAPSRTAENPFEGFGPDNSVEAPWL